MTPPSILTLSQLLDRLGYTDDEHVAICSQRPGQRFTSRTVATPLVDILPTELLGDVWYSVNPTVPTAGRGTAEQVTRLAAVWADLDIKPGGVDTMDVARTIVDELSDMIGTRPVALTYSGHGLQPIWAIEDHPLDTLQARTEARVTLRRWGRLVAMVADRHHAAVDSVFDLARVLRAPGTTNHKTDPVAVLTTADNGRLLDIREINDALQTYGVAAMSSDNEDLGEPLTDPDTWTWANHTCGYAAKTITGWANETPDARHPWLMAAAVRLAAMHANNCITRADHDAARRTLIGRFEQLISAGPQARKAGPGEIPDAFTWGAARVATMPAERVARELGNHPHLSPVTQTDPFGTGLPAPLPSTGTDGPQPATQTAPRPLDATRVGEHYGPTEDGTARALVHLHAATLRYCPQRGMWLHWTGSRWEWDQAEQYRERIRAIARDLPAGEGWAGYKRRALSAAGVTGIARLAQTDAALTVHIDHLDANPYELNTPGGIIDLRTGRLRPADPAALHTRSTGATPDFERPSELLSRFLRDTFGGDQAMTAFMSRLLGVAAIGTVLEQILPFAHGIGANGKSTLFDAVMNALGTGESGYAISAPSEMLMLRKHSEHPAELAQLAGARLVICSELDDGQRFAEARIKLLTGRDPINARFMRGNPFTFTPSHTFILSGNSKPALTAGGPAFERRLRFLPFEHVVPEADRDPHLGEKLAAEAPAILAWIARGAADYLARGRLEEPEAVKGATATYIHDQDTVGRFVEERCHLASSLRSATRDVRAAYEQWCSEAGEHPVSAKRLTQELRERFGAEDLKSNGVRHYSGVGIAEQSDPDADPFTEKETGWYR